MMNWMLPTFASLVLHSHWDRRAVITMLCLQRRLCDSYLLWRLTSGRPLFMSMDDLLEAATANRRDMYIRYHLSGEKKKAAALPGSVRSKPSTKNTNSLQPAAAKAQVRKIITFSFLIML